jgi:aminopeptidase N
MPRLTSLKSLLRIYPEWQVNTAFINDHLAAAFELDAKLSSHPIEVPCPDAEKASIPYWEAEI